MLEAVPDVIVVDIEAVKTISESEFSEILVLLNDNFTSGAASSSVIEIVEEIVVAADAFTTFLPVTVIVSSSSSIASSTVVIVALPDSSPAFTTICGFNKKRNTR